jgi:hypothetical protein
MSPALPPLLSPPRPVFPRPSRQSLLLVASLSSSSSSSSCLSSLLRCFSSSSSSRLVSPPPPHLASPPLRRVSRRGRFLSSLVSLRCCSVALAVCYAKVMLSTCSSDKEWPTYLRKGEGGCGWNPSFCTCWGVCDPVPGLHRMIRHPRWAIS